MQARDISLFRAGESYAAIVASPISIRPMAISTQIQFRQLAAIYPDSPMRKKADRASLRAGRREACDADYGNRHALCPPARQ